MASYLDPKEHPVARFKVLNVAEAHRVFKETKNMGYERVIIELRNGWMSALPRDQIAITSGELYGFIVPIAAYALEHMQNGTQYILLFDGKQILPDDADINVLPQKQHYQFHFKLRWAIEEHHPRITHKEADALLRLTKTRTLEEAVVVKLTHVFGRSPKTGEPYGVVEEMARIFADLYREQLERDLGDVLGTKGIGDYRVKGPFHRISGFLIGPSAKKPYTKSGAYVPRDESGRVMPTDETGRRTVGY